MRSITALLVTFVTASPLFAQQDTPKAADARLVVDLIAKNPDIVHPVACDFDSKGRLLVVESHTHFAPKGYKGPKHDRIRAFDVKTGKATTFFEGTRHTMDIAAHPDGAIYLATRNEILRLRETKGGVKSERIVFLDTKGDYPHNGLSGLCFDSKGELTFGMGENLGAKYTLIGSDGTKFTGQGDGGHIFHCTADGKRLRRVATGFWNPFGICRDIYGRTFAVDNDPDQAPPCRMLHVVEGGDYGFRFCYGRSGKHPFQSWHGELPGTLPMMTGVGEAPCEILSYESDGLPKEYLGQLLVTSWADHRVERYKVVPHGASFTAERLPFVQGGRNFRPTGMCVAPDGSIYVCDWVKSDYTLHGKGAIWRIREKQNRERKRPADPKEAILSLHRPLREAAARKLARNDSGRAILRMNLGNEDARFRAAALIALTDVGAKELVLKAIADKDRELGMREMAVREMGKRRLDVKAFRDGKNWPILRAEAIIGLSSENNLKSLFAFASNKDPFLCHAATYQILQNRAGFDTDPDELRDPKHRIALLLAHHEYVSKHRSDMAYDVEAELIKGYLPDRDETVRFLAVKWIADEKLQKFRKDIAKMAADPKLSVRMYIACATALARIDGKDVNERTLADYFAKRLADDKTPAAQRAMLLKQVPATHKVFTLDLFRQLTQTRAPVLVLEAVRATVEHPGKWGAEELEGYFVDPANPRAAREFATLGIAVDSEKKITELIDYAEGPFRDDALRALIGAKLTNRQRGYLEEIETKGKSVEAIHRVLGKAYFKNRPPAKDTDAWLRRLEGKADPDAGARVFFHPKLADCYKCHRIDGRGADVGPDLSSIGRTERRHILESILQPSANVAPRYLAWHLETAKGKTQSGMLIHTQLDEYTFLDAQGGRFKLKTGDLAEQRPLPTSIMPDGLADRLTDQEVRDLLAYLQARR